MVNKALKYLNNTINQKKLFNSIEEDITRIIKPYEFKKIFLIKSDNIGEIRIDIQDTIPTMLIKELDEYMGLNGVLEKSDFNISLIYKIEKGF